MSSPRALVKNMADRGQVRAARKREAYTERARHADVARVLALPEGRRFVWWLLEQCGAFQSVMRNGRDWSEFYAGQQDVGHLLLAEVKAAPDAYLRMEREAMAEDARRSEPESPSEGDSGGMKSDPDEVQDQGEGPE